MSKPVGNIICIHVIQICMYFDMCIYFRKQYHIYTAYITTPIYIVDATIEMELLYEIQGTILVHRTTTVLPRTPPIWFSFDWSRRWIRATLTPPEPSRQRVKTYASLDPCGIHWHVNGTLSANHTHQKSFNNQIKQTNQQIKGDYKQNPSYGRSPVSHCFWAFLSARFFRIWSISWSLHCLRSKNKRMLGGIHTLGEGIGQLSRWMHPVKNNTLFDPIFDHQSFQQSAMFRALRNCILGDYII